MNDQHLGCIQITRIHNNIGALQWLVDSRNKHHVTYQYDVMWQTARQDVSWLDKIDIFQILVCDFDLDWLFFPAPLFL